MARELAWRRICDCVARDGGPIAKTGQLITRQIETNDGFALKFVYCPGPSCVRCKTPWELTGDTSTGERT